MIRIWLHSQFARLADGDKNVWLVSGDNLSVRDVLNSAFGIEKNLLFGLIDETGRLRAHINIFVGNWNVRRNLDEIVKDEEEISIFPSVSGG